MSEELVAFAVLTPIAIFFAWMFYDASQQKARYVSPAAIPCTMSPEEMCDRAV